VEYKKGDWIVLGTSGYGWGGQHSGAVCQIEDIGPHLKGSLHSPAYDFYVKYDEKVFGLDRNGRPPQITRGPGQDGGGLSAKIARHATQDEIHGPIDLMKVLDL